jgi:ectoine hydroxylase
MSSHAVLAYPTRTGEAQMTYRQEPVAWCDPEEPPPGPLSASQIREYAENGFLVFPGLLETDRVAALNNELVHATREQSRETNPRFVLGQSANDVRRIHDIHVNRPEFAELASDDRLAGAARQLLDSDVYLHLARATILADAFGEAYPWHSDFEAWHAADGMPSMRCLGAEVLLSPAGEHSGAMVLSPGSHRTFISTTDQPGAQSPPGWEGRHEPDNICIDAVLERCGITRVEGPPGTVVLFDCNLLHATLPNLSPDRVATLFFAYNSVENQLGSPSSGDSPRPEWIAHRTNTAPLEAAPLER